MKALAKRFAHLVFGDYSLYDIYARSPSCYAAGRPALPPGHDVRAVDATALRTSPDPLVREQVGYAGDGSHAYALWADDRIVGVCFYWFGARYLTRNFWPLVEDEAKLVQIWVHPDARGRRLATGLIDHSFDAMVAHGFRRTYARIWHSNTPSRRAFERAGWTRIARVIEINPFRRSRPLRFRFDV